MSATASDSFRLLPPLRVPASWFSMEPRLTADSAAAAARWSTSVCSAAPPMQAPTAAAAAAAAGDAGAVPKMAKAATEHDNQHRGE